MSLYALVTKQQRDQCLWESSSRYRPRLARCHFGRVPCDAVPVILIVVGTLTAGSTADTSVAGLASGASCRPSFKSCGVSFAGHYSCADGVNAQGSIARMAIPSDGNGLAGRPLAEFTGGSAVRGDFRARSRAGRHGWGV
jgi:hypothetical protein